MFWCEILCSVLIVGGLLIALISYLKWPSVTYTPTTKCIIVLKGRFSKDLYQTRLDKMQDIRMEITPRQRRYNCGDIFVSTAGTSVVECMWQNIPEPRKKTEATTDADGKVNGWQACEKDPIV
jgi:uncharacterized membrane protein YdbT with pleckstrin-like domain